MGCEEDGLTTAQAAVSSLLSSKWAILSSPTVVILDAPTGRGKTHIIQNFYDNQTEGQTEGRRFWRGRLAKDDLRAWRQSRKVVTPDPVDITQHPDWLWLGMEGYPSGRVDLPREIHRLNCAIVDGYENDKLPIGAKELLRRGVARTIPSELLRAATDLIADLVPGGGLVKTGLETTLTVGRAVVDRDQLALPLSVDNPAVVGRALLVTSFAFSVLGELNQTLAPMVLAVDDAHLLDSSAVETLDVIVRANPEDELLASGLLEGKQREFAAARGMPPVAPILILATRQPLNESQPDYFGARVASWRQLGLTVITVDENRLPLIPEDEAVTVAARRLADLGLNRDQLKLVAEHAHDRLLNGINASLLIAHCERVWRLSDPRQTLTPEWAEQHLARFIEEDAHQRYNKLPLLAQKAVVAGSLRGPAFLPRSVSILLPELNEVNDWVDEVHNSGYAELSPIVDEQQFVFSDEPSFAYARDQAVRDSALCTRALTTVSAPLLKYLWATSTVGPMGSGRALYDFSRQEAYQYKELVKKANLRGETIDPQVWAGVLAFGAEVQFAMEESRGQGTSMRQLWSDMVKSTESLSGDGWALAARWVIHRHLPGPMTFGSAHATNEPKPLTWTRFHPRSPRIAALVATRILPFLLAENRPLLEPGLRLLLRLGFTGRLLSRNLRRSVATRLLQVAPLRLSAAAVLSRVYGRDLDRDQREDLHRVLLAGPAPDPGDARTRRSLSLAWLGHQLSGSDASQIIDDLVSACQNARLYEQDAFGVTGRVSDVSDPLVYPWAHQSIYAAAALLTARWQLPIPADAQNIALKTLLNAMDEHPGAAWLMSSGKVSLNDQQSQLAKAARTEWDTRGALEAGRFDLTGLSAEKPRASKKKHRRR